MTSASTPTDSRDRGMVVTRAQVVWANVILFVGFLLAFVVLGTPTWILVHNSGFAYGVVVGLTAKQGKRAHSNQYFTYYAPVVQYKVDGQTYKTTIDTNSEFGLGLGQEVQLIYDRANPNSAQINNFWYLWWLPTITVLAAIVVIVVFNAVALVMLRHRQ